MARGEAASASARSDSIKGLAQSVANPAYRRMLVAEPALRRAVPVLIIAFLLTVAVGALVQVLDHRRQALADAMAETAALADIVSERLERAAPRLDPKEAESALERAAARTSYAGRQIYLSGPEGLVIASWPVDRGKHGTPLAEIPGSPVVLNGANATEGAVEIALPGGEPAFAGIRRLPRPLGQIAALQTRQSALRAWRADTALTLTLSATTGFVLLILGFAFHWQATRAREADVIFDTVRSRIDTALNSGRCGLWDWDLARGRIFWSSSMFALLGLEPSGDLLTLEEVGPLVHPDDPQLAALVGRFSQTPRGPVDHTFRMRHASGRWVRLRARCELVRQPGETGGHVLGIAVDISEQHELAEKAAADEIRLRDAIEAISEAFVIWDAENRLVLCNSKFQSLNGIAKPDSRPSLYYTPPISTNPQPLRQPTDERPQDPPGLTFQAQLGDGRWLQISERRT